MTIMAKKTIKLGDKAKDRVSGFEGTVTVYATHLTGCDRVDRRREDGKDLHCPNGHTLGWYDNSPSKRAERAKAAEARAIARADQAEARARHHELSARAFKGHLTRMRNRVARGVCPAGGCKRSFDNLREHVADQHPELLDKLGDVL